MGTKSRTMYVFLHSPIAMGAGVRCRRIVCALERDHPDRLGQRARSRKAWGDTPTCRLKTVAKY